MTEISKSHAIKTLNTEYQRWNSFLSKVDDTTALQVLYDNRRLKDEVAHLWAWQVLSVARLKAVIEDTDPDFSEIIKDDFVPENDEEWDAFNELVFVTYHAKSWNEIYQDWQENYQNFMSLAEEISEEVYLEPGLFAWMGGQALIDVLYGSAGHHGGHWGSVEKMKGLK